jgi:Tfp pilus assembly major pilin PilA
MGQETRANSRSALGWALISLVVLAVGAVIGFRSFQEWEETGPARAAAALINAARLGDSARISSLCETARVQSSLEAHLREAAARAATPTPVKAAAQGADQVTAAIQTAAQAVGDFVAGLAGATSGQASAPAVQPGRPETRPRFDPATRARALAEPKALGRLVLSAIAYAGVDAPRDRKELTKFLSARTARLDETHAEIALTPDLVGALVTNRITILKLERVALADWRVVGIDLPPDGGPALR